MFFSKTLWCRTLLLGAILVQGCATQSPAPVSERGALPDRGVTTGSESNAPVVSSGQAKSEPTPAWKPNTQARTTLPAVVELLQRADQLMSNYAWDDAILVAERGLRIDARNPSLYLVLAKSYAALGERGKARLFAEQGRSLSASDRGIKAAFDEILLQVIPAS